MNIFYIDPDPTYAAQSLMDVHVRKMTLETCQLLMTHDVLNGLPRPYRPTHTNHPCRLSLYNINNYLWLVRYFYVICKEFKFRFDHDHACWDYYLEYYLRLNQNGDDPQFPQCMPIEFKRDTPLDGYRAYYKYKVDTFMQRGICKYTRRDTPYWL